MKKTVVLSILATSLLFGQCPDKIVNISEKGKISPEKILEKISYDCKYSIVYADKKSKEAMNEKISNFNVFGKKYKDFIDIFFEKTGMFYKIDDKRDILYISLTKTERIPFDYISTKRSSESYIYSSNSNGGNSNSLDAVSSGTNGGVQAGGSVGGNYEMLTEQDEFDIWNEMKENIKQLLKTTDVDRFEAPDPIVDKNSGVITVTGTKKQIENVKKYLKDIEKRLHQEVFIDVKIIALALDEGKNNGIDWSNFSFYLRGDEANNNVAFEKQLIGNGEGNSFLKYSVDYISKDALVLNSGLMLNGLFNFLRTQGKVYVISSPKIMTMNNQPAVLSIGEVLNYNVPTNVTVNDRGQPAVETYTPSSIFVGLSLSITPEVTKNGEIILKVNSLMSELKNDSSNVDTVNSFRRIAPDTTEKKLSTILKVKNNSVLVLGGLVSSNLGNFRNGVAFFQHLPVIGNLFKSQKMKNKKYELLYVLSPKIIDKKYYSFSKDKLEYINQKIENINEKEKVKLLQRKKKVEVYEKEQKAFWSRKRIKHKK